MRKKLPLLMHAALLLSAVLAWCTVWAADSVLQNGVPFNTSLPALTYANAYLDVPAGATTLTVTVTNGNGDLDLFMKFGTRLTGGTVSELEASADVSSEGPGPNETIVLTTNTSPPLRAGRWYIATLNFNSVTINFTLTAAYTLPGYPDISVSPTQLDFGTVAVGETSARSITVSNAGASSLSLSSVSVEGANQAEFLQASNCATIASGGNCSIEVTFRPTASGVRSAQLNISSNDPDEHLVSVSLQGVGSDASSGAAMAMPASQQIFQAGQILNSARGGPDPPSASPIGSGACTGSTGNLALQVRLDRFSEPVDVYFGLYAPILDAKNIYVLRPDNGVQTLSTGLVPWKRSTVGPVREDLFAEVPAAMLPHGIYTFYLVVAPAGRLDTFYIWTAFLKAPGACVAAEVPEGTAGYVNGSVVAPNAQIVTQGKVFDGTAPVTGNALVAIRKDGKTYLYHPALGHAALSDYNSRLAVGSFIYGSSVGQGEGIARPATVLTPSSQDYLSKAGVLVQFKDMSKLVMLKNAQRRWALVMPEAYALMPRDSYAPTNLFEVLEKTVGVPLIGKQDFYNERWVKPDSPKAIFGAISRVLPMCLATGGAAAPDEFKRSAVEALKADPLRYSAINLVDFTDYTIGAIQQITGILLPEECAEGALSTALDAFNVFLTAYVTMWDSGGDLSLGDPRLQMMKTSVYTAMQAMLKCTTIVAVGSTTTPIGGITLEGLYQFADIVSGLKWVFEDFLLINYAVLNDLSSYELIEFAGRPLPSFPATYAGAATMHAAIFNTKGNASCTGTFDIEISLTKLGDVTWRTNWKFDPIVTYPASCTITRGVWVESIFADWGTHDFNGNYKVPLFCTELTGTYDDSQLQGGCSWSDSGSSGDVSFVIPRKQ